MHERDVVVLKVDRPEYGLKAGDIGTVVLVHENEKGITGCEVEFVKANGNNIVISVMRKGRRSIERMHVLHSALGLETPFREFCQCMMADQSRAGFWENIASRVGFVDALQQETTLNYDIDVHGYSYGVFLDNQIQALAMYLLCTCLDAIANHKAGKPSLTYGDWLVNKKRKDESEKRDKNVASLLRELGEEPLSKEAFINASQNLYKFYTEEYGGLGHNIHELFQALPPSVQEYLANTYLISDGPTDPIVDDIVTKNWVGMPIDERIRLISDYLWKYRRNEYTHEIRPRPTTSPWHPYWDDSDPPKIVKWVLCENWEPWVLRDLIVTLCQIELGYSRDKGFLERSYKYRQRQFVLWKILSVISRNRSLLPAYVDMLETQKPREMMSIFYYGPLPRLETETIEAALKNQLLDRTLGTNEKGFVDWLEQYIATVKQLNNSIELFNRGHPHGNAHESRRLASIDFINELLSNPDYCLYINSIQTERFIRNVPHILIKPVPTDSSWTSPSD